MRSGGRGGFGVGIKYDSSDERREVGMGGIWWSIIEELTMLRWESRGCWETSDEHRRPGKAGGAASQPERPEAHAKSWTQFIRRIASRFRSCWSVFPGPRSQWREESQRRFCSRDRRVRPIYDFRSRSSIFDRQPRDGMNLRVEKRRSTRVSLPPF